jgi:hypothetical protein
MRFSESLEIGVRWVGVERLVVLWFRGKIADPMNTIPVGDYEGESHWQNGPGGACAEEHASVKVNVSDIILQWEGADAGRVTLARNASGGWAGKLQTGERCEFESIQQGDVVVLWGRWGQPGKTLDLDWFVRLDKV